MSEEREAAIRSGARSRALRLRASLVYRPRVSE